MSFVVTIDGPAAAGKSTTARAIAQRLGWRYLDTGAFYRALGLKSLRRGGALTDADAAALARATTIEFSGDPDGPRLVLDGEDVTDEIRTPAASDAASRVAALPAVRRQLVEWQRALRAREPLVGEGRDLGTVVFPDAEVKLYLDADPVTRLQAQGHQPGRHLVHFVAELAIGPADTLMTNDQGVGIGRQCRDTVQMHADRLADQWRRGRTMDIAPLKSGHRVSPDHVVFVPAPDASIPACLRNDDYYDMRGWENNEREGGAAAGNSRSA